ncbi:hypothetical protein [Primorskyibacter sp. S187A]|uniref:hypothetical protein n=1 Tax=Primorskyibacter sp. S187A TaxID=3415130 RepID=UPI003C7C8BB3
MWDFLKKAAGAVVQAGASYLIQNAAVERILQAPDVETGKAWLRAHVLEIEDEDDITTLLTVIETRHQQALEAAQNAGYDGSWGNTHEDKMAYMAAHIKTGTPMRNAEAERLVEIYAAMDHFTRLYWQEAQANRQNAASPGHTLAASPEPASQVAEPAEHRPSPTVRANAVKRHLDEISATFASAEPIPQAPKTNEPLDDIAALYLRLEADKAVTDGMFRSQPGQASEEVIDVLNGAYEKYNDILERGPASSDLIAHDDIRFAMGQAREFAGNACESLGAVDQTYENQQRAVGYFHEAQTLFESLGKAEEVKRVARKIKAAQEMMDGDTGEIPAHLHIPLDDPLQEADRLLDLASYHGDDPVAAIEMIHRAEALLISNGMALPDPEAMAHDLMRSIEGLQSGAMDATTAPLQRTMKIRSLHSAIFQMLHKFYKKTDPEDPNYPRDQAIAKSYMAKFEALDAQQSNQDFRDIMMGMMGSGQADRD